MAEVVWVSEDKRHAIVATQAAFGGGFNVYALELAEDGRATGNKINPDLSFFTTEEAARRWLDEYLAAPPAA